MLPRHNTIHSNKKWIGKMRKEKKTSSELIVDALRTGKELRLSEITLLMSKYSGTDIKIQNVSSTMAKLSDSGKTEIGYFINRNKTKKGYVYKLADEALELTREQTYGLIRKVGKGRFTLKEALERVPSLTKYVNEHEAKRAGRAKTRQNEKQEPRGQDSRDNDTGNFSSGFSIKDRRADMEDEVSANHLSQVLEQFKDGTLNINVNVNIRFVGSGLSD